MPWPDDDLEVTVEVAFGADLGADPTTWTWTDLSSRLIQSPITNTFGVVVGAGTTRTATCTGITLGNDDGWLTPETELSPYWPYVDVGTPARLLVRTRSTPYVTDTFSRTVTNGWGTADSGQPWLSVGTPYSVNGSRAQISVATAGTANINAFNFVHRDVKVTWDSSITTTTTGAGIAIAPTIRLGNPTNTWLWPLLVFQPDGSIGWWPWKNISGAEAGMTAQVLQPGLTYTPGVPVRAEVVVVGDRMRGRAWLASGTKPSGWALDVTVTDEALLIARPRLGFRAWVFAGNTNTLPNPVTVDNVTVEQPQYARIEGYLTDVRPVFRVEAGGTVRSQVQLSIGGIGSRLEKLAADEQSPMTRSLLKAPVPPTALWPCEDDRLAESAASVFPDGAAMTVTGPAVFGFDAGALNIEYDRIFPIYAIKGLCSVAAGAKLVGQVPLTSQAAWTVSALIGAWPGGVGGGITEMRLLEWSTPNTFPDRWALVGTPTQYEVRAYNSSTGTTTVACTSTPSYAGLYSFAISGQQSGGNVAVGLTIWGKITSSGSVAGTISMPTRVTVNPDQINTTGSTDPYGILFLVGQVCVFTAATPQPGLPIYADTGTGLTPRADTGWIGEVVHRRLGRLADEERVRLRVLGSPYTSGVTLAGVQQPGGFRTLMQQAADTESGGLLYEAEHGYVHDPRSNRYNRRVAMTVDMSAYRYSRGTDPASVLVPKLDARGPTQWTVQRRGGSAATAAADTAFRLRRGTVTDKADLDVLLDADVIRHATWRTHLSVDGRGANYPATVLDLAANPGLVDDYLNLTIGSRIQRTNQPLIAGYGTVDQVVDGITETITPRQVGGPAWTVTLDTSPAQVWQVGVWDGVTSLWQPANTVLSADVTTTAVTWAVNSNGEPWVTGAVSLRAMLGRELVLITNIAGSGSAWTMTVTRSVNTVVVAHTAGTEKLTLLDAGTWAL